MPHALSMPAPGFQAIILCGPGSSFPTFTANPDENPKALIPIANRPMVWYPIDFCYRMGVTNITLIAPPSSAPVITAALKTNPHLTGLPLPKPTLLAPKELDQNTGTAEIFRLPEVREIVKGDFIVLPCDLVCELGGESLLESWMIKEAGLGDVTGGSKEFTGPGMVIGGEKGGRRGGLGVWYETKGETIIKGEETDFIATSPLELGPVPPSKTSLLGHVSKLVYSIPTDTLNDITEEKKSLPIRHGLIRAHSRVRMLSSHRDAHIYIFPAWVMDMINNNEHMDSIGEDVLGWWAKAGWQVGLGEKLRLHEIFTTSSPDDSDDNLLENNPEQDNINYGELSSTWTSDLASQQDPNQEQKLVVPPILAYVHPKNSSKLIRRVDTAPLLLNVSLQLAKFQSIEEVGKEASSPFAHQNKVAFPQGIAGKTTVTRPDCLLAENVTVEEKSIIKETVIGANCQIKTGAKLTRCVLMDGVVVGKGCRLTGCILGRRCEIGDDSTLQDCEVQENLLVEAKTEDKNNKLMSSEGMEATEAEIQEFVDEDSATMDDGDASMDVGFD
ncbi:related to eukaryotic translation initiation factor EIF-2B subunit 3 [Phialocephala subalpina]|uniref:Translation initiation factor eIF2B subunit gamma n=1 Tax=Phialocephala subalpina TaxID=576137 RepID=A0A1L7XLT9_9HELO|nr:related to eukaryotic translation initiation factor EIF-2B subunit 3 [Phialocephala subalpina]